MDYFSKKKRIGYLTKMIGKNVSVWASKMYISLECKNFIIIPPPHQHFQAIRLVIFDKIDQNYQNNQSNCLKMLVRWWDDYEFFTF